MSDTPRTDALSSEQKIGTRGLDGAQLCYCTMRELARQLERELTLARAELDAPKVSGIPLIKRFHSERDRLANVLRECLGAPYMPVQMKLKIDNALAGIPTEAEQVDNIIRGLAEIMAEDSQLPHSG